MKAAIVIRAEPVPLFERAELPSNAFTGAGYRAQHECSRGGRWYGPARRLQTEALRDAVGHERHCHRQQGQRLRECGDEIVTVIGERPEADGSAMRRALPGRKRLSGEAP